MSNQVYTISINTIEEVNPYLADKARHIRKSGVVNDHTGKHIPADNIGWYVDRYGRQYFTVVGASAPTSINEVVEVDGVYHLTTTSVGGVVCLGGSTRDASYGYFRLIDF